MLSGWATTRCSVASSVRRHLQDDTTEEALWNVDTTLVLLIVGSDEERQSMPSSAAALVSLPTASRHWVSRQLELTDLTEPSHHNHQSTNVEPSWRTLWWHPVQIGGRASRAARHLEPVAATEHPGRARPRRAHSRHCARRRRTVGQWKTHRRYSSSIVFFMLRSALLKRPLWHTKAGLPLLPLHPSAATRQKPSQPPGCRSVLRWRPPTQ